MKITGRVPCWPSSQRFGVITTAARAQSLAWDLLHARARPEKKERKKITGIILLSISDFFYCPKPTEHETFNLLWKATDFLTCLNTASSECALTKSDLQALQTRSPLPSTERTNAHKNSKRDQTPRYYFS